MVNTIFGKSLISVLDITPAEIKLIFNRTSQMRKLVMTKGGDDRLKHRIMTALFYEPSTRTFSSFISAMQRLGGGIIPLNGMKNTSVEKGESFHHTVQVFSRYSDCLVIRHYQVGLPRLATNYITKPVINAGDGFGEHPTQALFDVYTIIEKLGQLDGLTITLVGDLKFGRTVHSLSQLLARLSTQVVINLVAPTQLRMPVDITENLQNRKVKIQETDNLDEVLPQTDVLYVTRVQKERFDDLSEYEKLKSYYIVDKKKLKTAKKKMIIMHPLPIAAGEIQNEVDSDSRSVYLNSELSNGLYLRMALLDLILNK